MDESEFQRLLQLFPVVRSRDYCAETSSSSQLPSGSAQDEELKEWQDAWDERDRDFENRGITKHDSFWSKLKSEAARKVHEELGLDAARRFLKSS
ncbi:uncharacterized protein LOC130733330 isoform X2 [Lotus japonicus]|uniref:Uncharacterized protein n=1 Tax=Lotus japonicus TaxID=34305 RepID=I3T6G5_LOTJA|nr:uncharacterized protein LOC130733330 isoform X2 [Lotus japonicus]AFK48107.1 unknown [Lotus japonicus]